MDLQGRIVKVYFKDLPENSELNFKISVSHSVAETVSNGVDICKSIAFMLIYADIS